MYVLRHIYVTLTLDKHCCIPPNAFFLPKIHVQNEVWLFVEGSRTVSIPTRHGERSVNRSGKNAHCRAGNTFKVQL